MLTLAKSRDTTPELVVMDEWYSSLDNLKLMRSHGGIWVSTLRNKRIVNCNVKLASLDILEEGLSIYS